MLLTVAPNVRPQPSRDGRARTLRPTEVYLDQLRQHGRAVPEHVDSRTQPGRLLQLVDPEAFDALARRVSREIPSKRLPEAYARTALAHEFWKVIHRSPEAHRQAQAVP